MAEGRRDRRAGPIPFTFRDPLEALCVDCRPRTRGEIARNLVIPFAIPAAVFFVLYLMLERDLFWSLAFWSVVYLVPPFGKESAIPLAIAGEEGVLPLLSVDLPGEFVSVPPEFMVATVTLIDTCCALFIILNFEYSKRIPLLGKYICRVESGGDRTFSKKPWLENLATTGIVLFVLFPFQGSGGITASIIGRAIGMNRSKLLVAIAVGAFTGAFIIAYSMSAIISLFRVSWQLGLLGLALLAVAVAGLAVIYRRKNRQMMERREGSRP